MTKTVSAGNVDANPRFVSLYGFDHLLRPASPCIDAGDTVTHRGRRCAALARRDDDSWPEVLARSAPGMALELEVSA